MNYNINKIKLEDLPIKLIEYQLQSDYNKDLNRKRFNIQCSNCKAREFKYHGSYERHIYLDRHRHLILIVVRKVCLSCQRTCVILPSYLVKYKRYTLPYLFKLVKKISISSLNRVHKKLKHSLGYLSYIYQQYLKQHRLRVRALEIEALECINDFKMNHFFKKYLENYFINFMEIA